MLAIVLALALVVQLPPGSTLVGLFLMLSEQIEAKGL